MTRTYTIHSSNGFIGFCYVFFNQQMTQGGLSLYETVQVGNNTMMYQQATKYHIYTSSTSDIDIIKDLMQKSIPSLMTNGLTYSAIDCVGQSQTI